MARWRLVQAHYLNGRPPDLESVEWEYKETDRMTGREKRKRFIVPYYADADSIVCYEGKGQPTDIIFSGDPTPDMDPLDDEARAISAKYKDRWINPIEAFDVDRGSYSQNLLENLERQVAELSANTPRPVADSGVSKAEFDALKEQIAILTAQLMEKTDGQSSSGIQSGPVEDRSKRRRV